MFTGIIKQLGSVEAISEMDGGRRLSIAADFGEDQPEIGASIACSGVCLTVETLTNRGFTVAVSGETLSRTAIGTWTDGTRINLERALRVGDELGGHYVFGHVDGLAEIERIESLGENRDIWVKAPESLAPFIAEKGSVALDGISLTVNEVAANEVTGSRFRLTIIPHTWAQTTLADKREGDQLHIEADMLARYAARILQTQA